MKKLLQLFWVALLICIQAGGLAFAQSSQGTQNTQNFSFESFNADYYLTRDAAKVSHLNVKETLVANFPETNQNHGILRAIPKSYKGHPLYLNITSVTNENGMAYPYTTSEQNGNEVLKIGNPYTYVHGLNVYVISYQMQDTASFYSDHDEFYWNINGDQWAQPFGMVTANIHIPADLAANLQARQVCYAGTAGSTANNCSITRTLNGNETVVKVSANNLQPYQALTTVLGFKPQTFQLSLASQHYIQLQKEEKVAAAILALALPAVALLYMLICWRRFGNDPKGRGVIIPEYEPPKGFDAMLADFLLKEKLRSVAVSAEIIEKAIAGFITIYEIPKKGFLSHQDYELQLNAVPQGLYAASNDVLGAIFGSLNPGTRISLNSIQKDSYRSREIYNQIKRAEDELAKGMSDAGYFRKNPKNVKRTYAIIGGVLAMLGFGGIVLGTAFIPLIGVGIGAIVAGIIVFAFSFIMPARTPAGVQVHDTLLGLKDYIKLAEADRIKFLQSPAGAEKIKDPTAFDPQSPAIKVKLFEKLLPYAMLFGLEKDWAKQFNDIYITPPGWYQGGNWTAFNAGYLVGSLNGFSAASTQSFATSSSSSGSGFGGGGFAGGGGGGGGGGGW